MTKNSKTIQEKITALQELTAWFESDEFELERALDVFKQAEELAAEIETDLKKLKNDVQVVAKKFE
jgi:exodeoxyribonuclease VII small subunit